MYTNIAMKKYTHGRDILIGEDIHIEETNARKGHTHEGDIHRGDIHKK